MTSQIYDKQSGGPMTLEGFGKVVAAIHAESDNPELCFWTFIRYVSINHSSILGVELAPDLAEKCDVLLERLSVPTITLAPSTAKLFKDEEAAKAQSTRKSPWWMFWRRAPRGRRD